MNNIDVNKYDDDNNDDDDDDADDGNLYIIVSTEVEKWNLYIYFYFLFSGCFNSNYTVFHLEIIL